MMNPQQPSSLPRITSRPAQLTGRRILLGVCGGIAAYKSAYLTRLLVSAGAEVQVVMTEAATQFIGEQTFQALSGRPVRRYLWDSAAEAAMGHIELARWAEIMLIAPCTANTMARLSMGMADDLLTTLCLASERPLFIAPAMNQAMWHHPSTQENIQRMQGRGVHFIGPTQGDQACGDNGPGRMSEPDDIVLTLQRYLNTSSDNSWSGQRVLITAGPTYEDIDPVRFIGNRSSGRMGYALAQVALQRGAQVALVSGPVVLPPPLDVAHYPVRSAEQMAAQVFDLVTHCDVFIAAAAVADYRVAKVAAHKLKKQYDEQGSASLSLELVANPDILAQVCALPKRPYCVGFAAETENLEEYARAKRRRKGADMIAANWVGAGRGFEVDENALWVCAEGFEQTLPATNKQVLAGQLLDLIAGQRSTLI